MERAYHLCDSTWAMTSELVPLRDLPTISSREPDRMERTRSGELGSTPDLTLHRGDIYHR